MGKLWLNSYIVSRWIKINVGSLDRKLLKYGYVCKTNKQEANTSVFVYFRVKEWLSKQFRDACLNFETVVELSFSDILYDKGTIVSHDNTCPCNPLRKKTLAMNFIRYSAFLTNSSSAKSQLYRLLSLFEVIWYFQWWALVVYFFKSALLRWWNNQEKYSLSTLWVFA